MCYLLARDHATTRPRDHATTRPRDHATTTFDCVRGVAGSIDRVASMHRVCFLLGGILLVAATLKAESFFASSTSLPWYLEAVLVPAELALAGFLFSGAMPLHAWWAAVLCFGYFALVAGVKTWQGAASCGCFGAVATPPWVALAIDLSALGALFFKYHDRGTPQRTTTSSSLSRLPTAVGFALIVVVGMKAVVSISSARPTQAADDPAHWVGQRLPLLDEIDVGREFATGKWMVVFHRHDCPRCGELLNELRSSQIAPGCGSIAIVQLPPFAHVADLPSLDGALSGRLRGGEYRTIPVPLVLQLNNGRVEAVVDPAEFVWGVNREWRPAFVEVGE